MIRLLGKDPFREVLEKSFQSREDLDCSLPLSDEAFCEESLAAMKLSEEMLGSIRDRALLREFCARNGLSGPQGKRIATFEGLSKYVISRKTFPLAIKSCRNRSNGTSVFRLEGFRELSRFFDRLQNQEPAPVWVEDWVKSEAVIEVTQGPGDFSLIAQLSLDKKLVARPLWRQFPVKLPGKFQESLANILKIFESGFPRDSHLMRFTIGLTKKEAVLLSFNVGWNRLEYFPGWTEPFGILPALSFKMAKRPAPPEKKFKIGRLQFFYRSGKSAAWPTTLPREAEGLNILQYLPADRQAAVLFGGDDPASLQENARILTNILSKSLDTDEL